MRFLRSGLSTKTSQWNTFNHTGTLLKFLRIKTIIANEKFDASHKVEHNALTGGDNNVSRMTANVIRRFVDEAPLESLV